MKTLPKEQHALVDGRKMAALLNVSPRTLGILSRDGRIETIKLNRRLHRYDAQRVLAALNQGGCIR